MIDSLSLCKAIDGTVVLRAGAGEIKRVRIARSFRSRLVGLLDRSDLESDEGLLFAPGGSIHTLWMRFCIDVIFLDENLSILRVAADIKPWRLAWAPRRTRFVLELAAGAALRIGLHQRETLHVSLTRNTSARH